MIKRTCHIFGALLLFIWGCKSNSDANKYPYYFIKRYPTVFTVKGENIDGAISYIDTLGLFCRDIPTREDSTQKRMHWAYLSSRNDTLIRNPDKIMYSGYESIKNTDSELCIHPPREGKYKVLQICPYPYIEFPLAVNKEWSWDFNVGSLWCIDSILNWKGIEVFHFKYKVQDAVIMKVGESDTKCYVIRATSTSRFGQSSLDMYYSYDYGIVKMVYTLITKRKIEFNLLPNIENSIHFEQQLINNDNEKYFSSGAL